ncbi:transcription factor [Maudiozyma humilis]|uniref:Transcription factor MBP1 n=1 Tax=Maudiozyma humilis TaxID=51915 RepID=A0AAV5RQU8_MAUHU|nr:transcription factor [Kazachstania humilis]
MSNQIYSAKYSGVDVYEFLHPTGSIMKRKKDHWVNATHILKAANFGKAKRTRILEKEVLKETHEKVQGGFGKYQGTWVPLSIAEDLARKFNVYDELRPLFDFRHIEGMEEPPQAPKHHHTSRADSKKKATKSASMSALADKRSSNANTAASGSRNSAVPGVGDGVTPVVAKRRGRPPKALQEKRRLAAGTELQRSRSDIAFSRTHLQTPSINLKDAIVTTVANGQQPNSNIIQYRQQFKEIDIDDGLSSDIEQQTTDIDNEDKNNVTVYRNQKTVGIQGSGQIARNQPSVSIASSPSLPTSPSDLSDENPFEQQRFEGIGTSPVVSSIPKYPAPARPPSTDINDKVNKYLAKLVDYFISNEVRLNKPVPQELLNPPTNSSPFIDAPIDPEMHTAFHWACSMGSLSIAEALSEVGASPRTVNSKGQTPLMRSAMFHNSYTKRTFPRIFQLLHETVFDLDSNGQSVIHHIVKRKSSTPSAVYYLEILLSKLKDFAPQYRIEVLLNAQDANGDTALHLAAKNKDKLFFDMLVQNGALSTTVNKEGVTPDAIMNLHYQEQVQQFERSNQTNSTKLNTNKSQNDLNLDGSMMSPSDYIMYPSQAATRMSRGLPTIISSIKDIAEQYNDIHRKHEDEIKSLENTMNRIRSNVKNIKLRMAEVLVDSNEKTGGDINVGALLSKRSDDIKKLQSDITRRKQKLKDDMNKRQRLMLNKNVKENLPSDVSENDTNRLKLAVQLTLLQESRKRKITDMISVAEDNLKIHKYRKMISEGTEIAVNDVDNCLDVILETLTRQST